MESKTQEDINRKYGKAFIRTKYALRANQSCICELFKASGTYRYIRPLKKYEQYDKTTGLWVSVSEDEIAQKIRCFALSINTEYDPGMINVALSHSVTLSITRYFRNAVGIDYFPQPITRLIHLQDQILYFSAETKQFSGVPFSPHYNSYNRIKRSFRPEAKCLRFLNDLVVPMLRNKGDLRLLQLYFGQCLLKENISQTLMIISGPASVGKSVLVNILEGLLGVENVSELHLDRLAKPFELIDYASKNLLTAKDIENDALTANKINSLKKMTGNDLLSAEQKHKNTRIQVRGTFNIIITGNGDLTLDFGSSRDAFKRRMIWIDCVVPENFRREDNFDQVLLKEEGDGILAWAIEGARMLLASGGIIEKGNEQEEALEFLLGESSPIETFIKNCIKPDSDNSVLSQEIVPAFFKFAHVIRWNNAAVLGLTPRQVEQKFRQCMLRLHPEYRYSPNVKVPGIKKMLRGYMNCKIVVPESKN